MAQGDSNDAQTQAQSSLKGKKRQRKRSRKYEIISPKFTNAEEF